MKEVDLRGKHFLTLGMKNCGKSFFNNYLMANTSEHYICFDPLEEHTDYSDDDLVVVPTERRGEEAYNQLDEIVEFSIANRDNFGYLWVDEVNRFHSKGGELDGPIGDVVDLNAHYGMGVGMIARRPVQVHTDIRELADYIFVFRLNGARDVRILDDIARGLGEAAASLDQREFIAVFPDRTWKKMSPIQANLKHEKGI